MAMQENNSTSISQSESSSSLPVQNACTICLEEMLPGAGLALFTSECSHTFHFRCIALNSQHGNLACPLCKAQWRQLPFQEQSKPQQQPQLRASSPPQPRCCIPTFRSPDRRPIADKTSTNDPAGQEQTCIEVRSYTEYKAVEHSMSKEIAVLIHLQAPASLTPDDTSRAPLDLVAVLDVSYSMEGQKVQLLKQAMNFVVQQLHSSDRLSIVCFSHIAEQELPLKFMTIAGKLDATKAIASMHVIGRTSIADGLIVGADVMKGRKQASSISGILFLSDGQDNCSFLSKGPENIGRLPSSITGGSGDAASKIPVHAFGFGSDHDAVLMSSIAEASGGTFSFVESEGDIQDAFALCLGGLTSVAFQNVSVKIECADPEVRIIGSIQSGSYVSSVEKNLRAGSIKVGDIYAGETRDFIMRVNVPKQVQPADTTAKLLYLKTVHKDPVSKRVVESGKTEVTVSRPVELSDDDRIPCPEVEQQKRRYEASEAMAAAKAAADKQQYTSAVSLVERCRRKLFRGHNDDLSLMMDSEMQEMEGRIGDQASYENHGRAFMLAGIISHGQQRATARSVISDRDSTSARRQMSSRAGSSASQARDGLVPSPYRTRAMEQMVCQSQASTDPR